MAPIHQGGACHITNRMTKGADMKISILMVTYNAPRYVFITLNSLRKHTHGIDYEVICVDNNSRWLTRLVVMAAYWIGWIDRLCLSRINTFFAGGNNLAARIASPDGTHYLLLNSDVEIRRDDWLNNLVRYHQRGLTSYGIVEGNPIDRLDGYCLLIDRDIYDKHQLDEEHQMWWCVSILQARAMQEGYPARGFREHEQYIHHFGGKSGPKTGAKGMDEAAEEVISLFGENKVGILDGLTLTS